MGKDRRKKDTTHKQTDSDDVGSGPKSQREPRNRASQDRRERGKTRDVENADKNKTVVDVPPQPLPKEELPEPDTRELFANLKRETDDIKALNTKKTPSRQIFSTWATFKKELPDPNQDVELQGADFIDLVQAPTSVGGHFQFKSEKTWDASVAALSGELFSLNIDLLSGGLATIPFHEKLGLPLSLFSADEVEDMTYHAKQSLSRYESMRKNKTGQFDLKQNIIRMQEILSMKETSPVPSEEISVDKNADTLNFEIEESEIQEETSEVEKDAVIIAPVNDISDINQQKQDKTLAADLSKEIPTIVKKSDHHKPNSIETSWSADLPKNVLVPIAPAKEVQEVSRLSHHEVTVSNKSDVSNSSAKQTVEMDKKLSSKTHRHKNVEVTPGVAKPVSEYSNIRAESPEAESKITAITSKNEPFKAAEAVKEVSEVGEDEPQNSQEPAVPLGQRSSRRKPKHQPAAIQKEKVEEKKSADIQKENVEEKKSAAIQKEKVEEKKSTAIQKEKIEQKKSAAIQKEKVEEKKSRNADDDLDFLLGLKKPVKTILTPVSQSVQVTKPTIEDDDANANSPQISLVGTQQKTEDLEDWLDSMLDD